MKNNLAIFIFLIVCFTCCTKEGGNANNNSSSSSGTGGSLARFTIVNNYLYIADEASIEVFDISQANTPTQVNNIYVNWNIETIFPYDNNLFIGSSTGMYIYSLENAANPVLLGQVQHLRSCDPVVANDSFAYVTLRGGTRCGPAAEGLYIYTLKDILNPSLIQILEMPTPSGLALNGNILYVCQQSQGLSVVDASNSSKAVIKKTIKDDYFEDAIVYGNLLICYVKTGLRLYDISVADNPVFISDVAN